MTQAEAFKKKLARHYILEALNMLYPSGIRMDSLNRILLGTCPTYDLGLLAKDATYLKEKGYLEFIDEVISGGTEFKKKVAKLTAEGKEIADKITTDPALEI